ncbi:hypothetical protein ABK040_010841 [Willaertia magna]
MNNEKNNNHVLLEDETITYKPPIETSDNVVNSLEDGPTIPNHENNDDDHHDKNQEETKEEQPNNVDIHNDKTTKPIWKLICFSLYYIGMSCSSTFVLSILLPKVIIFMLGDTNKEIYLSIIISVSTALSLFAGPLFGQLSDKYLIRYPFFFGALVCWSTCIALEGIIVKIQDVFPFYSIPFFVTFSLLIIVSKNFYVVCFAVVSALIADLIPKEQMNLVSTMVGIFQLIGVVIGVIVSGIVLKYIDILWLCIAFSVLCLVTGIPVLVFIRDVQELDKRKTKTKSNSLLSTLSAMESHKQKESQPEIPNHIEVDKKESRIVRIKNYIVTFVSPFGDNNFLWVFITRFSIMLTNVAARSYFLYFIRDVLTPFNFLLSSDFPSTDEQALSLLLGCICVFTLIGAGLAQPLTRHLGKRMVFFLLGIMLFVSGVVIAIFRTYNVLLVCSTLQGIGVGFFLAVDLSFANAVLPNPDQSAKDLALWNFSSYIPDLLGVPFGAFLIFVGNKIIPDETIRGFGYILLFSVAAALQLAAGILIFKVKLPSDVDKGIKNKTNGIENNSNNNNTEQLV